jgi:hypothetical protein
MRNYSCAAIPSDDSGGKLKFSETLHRHRCAVHDLLDDLFCLFGFLQGR